MKFINTLLAAIFLFCLPAYAEPYIRIKNIDPQTVFPEIRLKVSITDRRGFTPSDISEENILLYEDGYRMINMLKVEKVRPKDDTFYLVFSIDSSRSISKDFLAAIKKSALTILNNAAEKDKISVYRFNDEVKLLTGFTHDRKRIRESIGGITRHGDRTLLYNSIFDSLEVLEKIEGKRKGIIVFTDGKDEGSSVTENDIINLSKTAGLPVNFICLKTSRNLNKLSRISKLTGGKLVLSSNIGDIAGIYKSILSYGNNRYLIKYRSGLKKDGMEHRVEVKLSYGRLRDSHTKTFQVYKSFLDLSLTERPIVVLMAIIFLLILLLILIISYFNKREKFRIMDFSQMESQLPKIRPVLKEAGDSPGEDDNDSILLSDDPGFSYTDAWLVEKSGPETGKKFPIYFNEVILGRSEESSIVIDDEAVSMKHAKIKASKTEFTLYDLVSENGTFLNGNKLLRPKPLNDWDIIKIGRTELIFRGSKTDS